MAAGTCGGVRLGKPAHSCADAVYPRAEMMSEGGV